MIETEYLTGPPPLSQAEIDAIERANRKCPPGSDAETIRDIRYEIRFLLASPSEQDQMIEGLRLRVEQLQGYTAWLQGETKALQQDTLAIKQWILEHHGPEHLAHLEREFKLQDSIGQGNHKKTASVTIVMSPTLRSSLEKIAQRHRVTIAAWVRDVLHHAALEYYPESSE